MAEISKNCLIDYVVYNNLRNIDINNDIDKEILQVALDLYNQVKSIYLMSNNKEIKNDQFKEYYIKSKIPFKSNYQAKYLNILCLKYGEEIESYSFESILNLLYRIFNKVITPDIKIDEVKKSVDDKYLTLNVKNKKNGVDTYNKYENELNSHIKLLKAYASREKNKNPDLDVNKFLVDFLNQYKTYKKDLVGYVGEKRYFETFPYSSDIINVWVSKDVNEYEHLDFISYNLKTNKTNISDIKTTRLPNKFYDVIISESEYKETLLSSLEEKDVSYSVHRLLFDPFLEHQLNNYSFVVNNRRDFSVENSDGDNFNKIKKLLYSQDVTDEFGNKIDTKYIELFSMIQDLYTFSLTFEDDTKKLINKIN